jgi:hypothetical protein
MKQYQIDINFENSCRHLKLKALNNILSFKAPGRLMQFFPPKQFQMAENEQKTYPKVEKDFLLWLNNVAKYLNIFFII